MDAILNNIYMGHDRIYSREQNISSISSLHCAVNETAITEWKSEKNAFECVGEKNIYNIVIEAIS